MTDKARLRKIKSVKRAGFQKPAEPEEDPEPWPEGPHRMPVRGGHPDTEIHFVTDDGKVVGKVRLTSIRMGRNESMTAEFKGLDHFAPLNLNPFAGYTDHECVPMMMSGDCALCGASCVAP